MVTGGSVGFNGATVFEHWPGTEWRGNGGGGAQRGAAATVDRRRWLRPKEGEEGAGRVGLNGQERSGLGRMAGGPISGKGNGVGWGCHGNHAEMRFGLQVKNRNCFANFWFKEMGFKSKVLNISKPNLNWIQNRTKSNQLFENF
jgi:hypothetical protein